jgi:probable phosphoglycerate mutase
MLLIARHGETPLNAARVLQLPDTPLSARGLAQAERLADRLAALGVARILTSDYARARMTAERVSARVGVALELEPLLRERNFGHIRGRPYAELPPDLFGPSFEPPGGETWSDFHARVAAAWQLVERAARETSGNVAVLTHGLVCRVFLDRHLGRAAAAEVPRSWGNTSLTIAESVRPWMVRELNCTAHLDGLTLDAEGGAA